MERPRVKTVFPPIPLGNGKIRIGGFDLGLAAELDDDEQGHTWHLLKLLDGSNTHADLAREMHRYDPKVSPEDVTSAVAALATAGYLEDAAELPPATFSAEEVERYRRNIEFFSHFPSDTATAYEMQHRLKSARVTVLGVGGLGTYAALALTALGVGELLLVDYDVVELANLNRQVLYTEEDIGRPKVAAAADRLAQVNPHVRVTAVRERLSGPDQARAMIAGRNLLVCAADRPRRLIYEWLNAATIAERVPWIRGGNAGLTASAFLHVPFETACYACVELAGADELPWLETMNRYIQEHLSDSAANPCTAPVAGLLGSVVAMEAAKYLTGATRPAMLNRRMVVDLARLELRYMDGRRRDDCPACGPVAAATKEAAAWESP
ncbi:HesA/MoeB/ThiF family protein [Phytohabitans sp. LJ34]|uniref:HesA/MoeB/ThiF family protein n=1 Tax=Phytohabitans sp. LJ34 TaxID=3452217 RepID=UPI003F8B66A3